MQRLTHIGFDYRSTAGEEERATECDRLPDSARSDRATDFHELRPERQVRVTMESSQKELPQLDCCENSKEIIYDGIET